MKRVLSSLAVALLGALSDAAFGADAEWNLPTGGSWQNASSWLGPAPHSPGDAARFFANHPTSNAIIALSAPVTIGELTSANAFQINIDAVNPSANTLSFDSGNSAPALISVLHPNGRVRVDTSIVVANAGLRVDAAGQASRVQFDRGVSGQGEIVKQGAGTLQLNADNANWSGALWVTAGVVEVSHAGGFGSSAGGTFVNGGVLRFTQPMLEDIDLNTGRIVAANTLDGKVTMHAGELTFAHAGPHSGNVESHGGRITVESAASIDLRGELNLFNGQTTELAVPSQRTLNIAGGGAGDGDLFISGRGRVNVNDFGVLYEGALNVAGRIDFNAPSAVRSLYVDAGDPGVGGVEGAGSLYVSDSIVLRSGGIRFQHDVQGLNTDVPVQKIGLTSALLAPGMAFTGDVVVEAGSLRVSEAGLGASSGVTIVRGRNAELMMTNGDADETIRLENATGFAYRGGIRLGGYFGDGEIQLGDEGSIVGFQQGLGTHFQYGGKISGGALQLVGSGELQLAAGNHNYTGETIVGGQYVGVDTVLDLRKAGALHSTSGIVINDFAIVRANNREDFSDVASEDRIGDDIPIQLRGGDLILTGRSGVSLHEVVGNVLADRGESSVGVDVTNPDTVLSIKSVVRANHATLAFRGAVNVDPSGATSAILVENAPALQNGIIGAWATANGGDFASYSPDAGIYALSDTVVRPSKIGGAAPDSHVQLYDSESLNADATTATLRSFADVNLNGHTLVLGQGGAILDAHPDDFGIKNGVLTSGSDELILFGRGYDPAAEITLSATIVDNAAGAVAFTKAGSGIVALSGQNTYTGGTTVNEGVLRLKNARALPAGGDLTLDGGELQVMFTADENNSEIELGEFQLRGFSFVRMQLDGAAPAIRANAYHLESGELSVPLAGNGTLIKTTRGRVDIRADNSQFSGDVVIDDGVLVANVIGEESDDLVQPLGTGKVLINPDGVLAHRTYSRPTNGYRLDANLVLNGGEIAAGAIDPARPFVFRGTIDVAADSRISMYDAENGQVFYNGITMQWESDATIRDDVVLRTTGPGEFRFDGPMRVGHSAGIEAIDNLTRLRGVITSNDAHATLSLTGATRFSMENSLHARQGESLSITVDNEVVPLTISGPNRYALGGGVVVNPLDILAGGRLRPGDEIGVLTVDADVTWGSGGVYEWEINDASGAAGAAQGWDVLSVTQTMDVTATADQPFLIKLAPFAGANSPLEGFNPFTSFEWVIAEAGSLNASPASLRVDDSAFRAAFGDFPLGEFRLELSDTWLAISYLAASCLEGEAAPCDGAVDLAELNAVRNHFGAAGALGLPGDVYPFDGRVDLGDLNLVRNNFGAGATFVPEPAAGLLLMVGLSTLRWASRRATFAKSSCNKAREGACLACSSGMAMSTL